MKLALILFALLGLVLGAFGQLCGCQPDPMGPLCASDGNTYSSVCEMNCKTKYRGVYKVRDGACL
ncbi:thrombin inhibitor rhodniin-like [Leguminivora glycinivorella]|uniref:thrombin inhibitor rhodniin-like n=1 Tax=Leguminivora glycinivorella TaxID=1035111 RepID=UPI00201003C9|nr:thrombin inhibitor rhodniin-like [Leguminivora glycinivorella]